MAEEENSSSDESLNARSDKFDPIKAIYSPKTKIPSLDAPVYDNVSKYESKLKGSNTGKNVKVEEGESSTRKFLSHQGKLCSDW